MLNISRDKSVTIRAGAGAGKTTQMVAHVLRLLQQTRAEMKSWPRIVVTTFTRKATQELRERVLTEALKTQDAELIRYIQRSSGLQISTIHGVLMQYLSLFGERIGLPPRLGFLSDEESFRWKRRLLKMALSGEDPSRVQALNLLLEETDWRSLWAAIELWQDTQASVEEGLRGLTREDLESQRRLQLDRLHEAAVALARSLESEEKTKSLENFETLLRPLVRRISSTEPLAAGEWIRLWTDFDAQVGRKPAPGKKVSGTFLEVFADFYDQLRGLGDWSWTDDFINKFVETGEAFDQVAKALSSEMLKLKLSRGLITTNDLETLSLRLLHLDPTSAATFAEGWNFWMVDEYQDTSPRQVKLIEALSQGRPKLCVGDPQQSIYLFRGARTEVFEKLLARTVERGGERHDLMKNWRSRRDLLLFINQFFADFNPAFAPMEPAKDIEAGDHRAVVVWSSAPAEEFSAPADESFDLQASLARIQELLARGVQPSEICILLSTNQLMDDFAEAMNELGISYQRNSGQGFYDYREIADAGALLRFLVNPHDNVNLVNLLRASYFCMTDAELAAAAQKALGSRSSGSFSLWQLLTEEMAEQADVIFLKGFLQRAREQGVSNAWESALVELNFFDESYSLDPSGEREARLWQFVSMVKSQETSPGFSYLGFLTRLEEGDPEFQQNMNEMPPARVSDRVQMMTIHASKGLEFEHVILPFLGKKGRPRRSAPLLFNAEETSWSWSVQDPEGKRTHPAFTKGWSVLRTQQEDDEKDRLLYVAMTRAKVSLSLIWGFVDKESWASRFPDFSQDRYHEFVEVRQVLPTVGVHAEKAQEAQGVREPWSAPSSEAAAPSSAKTLSVTELLPEAKTSAPPPMVLIEAALKGNAIHRELESIKYRGLEASNSEWMKTLREFRNGLVLEILANGEVESGFIATLDGLTFQGQIDLWGRDSQGRVWVVDYKSGSAKGYEKAFLQLEYYSLALKLMGKIGEDEEVHCLPLYLFDLPASRSAIARPFAELKQRYQLPFS